MIYFDTAYILKCFVPEEGSAPVRALFNRHRHVATGEFARLEFASSLRRVIREGKIPQSALDTVFQCLTIEEQVGGWIWLPISRALIEHTVDAVRGLRPDVYIRSGDALHLTRARENGFREIFSNDRHLLAAAPHFGLRGVNVIP
jgi:predicted nucleic acid-binding protein